MLGDEGLLHKMQAGAMSVELSSIDSRTSVKLQAPAKKKGIWFQRCTLRKTPAQAEKAEELMFIGGYKELFSKPQDI